MPLGTSAFSFDNKINEWNIIELKELVYRIHNGSCFCSSEVLISSPAFFFYRIIPLFVLSLLLILNENSSLTLIVYLLFNPNFCNTSLCQWLGILWIRYLLYIYFKSSPSSQFQLTLNWCSAAAFSWHFNFSVLLLQLSLLGSISVQHRMKCYQDSLQH